MQFATTRTPPMRFNSLIGLPGSDCFSSRTNAPLDRVELSDEAEDRGADGGHLAPAWADTLPDQLRAGKGYEQANGYVQLPFRMTEVVEMVQRVLREAT